MPRKDGCYTVGQMAQLAGVSARALRHYEDVGLLAPARGDNGYRLYSKHDARRLAQVLSMRACGLPLITIRAIFDNPNLDVHAALVAHLELLNSQEESLRGATERTRMAIAAIERMENMEVKDAFEALKAEGLDRLEREYGQEARERYGEDAVDATNKRLMNLNRDEWEAKELLEESIKVQLRIAMAEGNPNGEAAVELTRMHERWIRIHWGDGYNKEAHKGLARGYLADPRFRAYYDGACGEGATEYLVNVLETNL